MSSCLHLRFGTAACTALALLPAVSSAASGPTIDKASSAQISAAAREVPPAVRETRRRDYVREQASAGRLVDAASVEVADFQDLQLAWDAGITPPTVEIRTAVDKASGQVASRQFEMTTSDSATSVRPSALGGAGLGSAVTTAGSASLLNSSCLLGTATNGKMTWCYERFKVNSELDNNRDYYISNRYSYTEGNTWAGYFDWRTVFNRIRTDPHSSYPGRVNGLGGFSPNSASQNCSQSAGSLSVGSFTMTIPWSTCAITAPEPNAAAPYSMGVYYQGPVGSPRTRGLDFAAVFKTPQGGAAPVFYYVNQAQFCNPGVGGCTGGTWTN